MRNRFQSALKSALKGRKVGGRASRGYSFAPMPAQKGSPITNEGLAANGVQSFHKPIVAGNVLNTGRRSHWNDETPLHNNAVSLTLTNNDANNQADLVLSAGRFGSSYSSQLIADGTANITNDAGDTVSVTVTCEYGVDGTTSGWADFRSYIINDGVAIGMTRMEFDNKAQRAHKLRFERRELFGDNIVDHIFPQVYYSPHQFDGLTVQSPVAYALDDKTIVKYTLRPGETVVLTMWVDAIFEKERVLSDHIRRKGGNSLM